MNQKYSSVWVCLSLLCLTLFFGSVCFGSDAVLMVGNFSQSDLGGWEEKRFEKPTRYEFVQKKGRHVLKAQGEASASGLVREIRVDLEKYPYLNWSWKLETKLSGIFDETTRAGDDYAARVYVVISGGIFFWKTLAVNYVWARHSKKGRIWANAFAGKNAMHLALRSGTDPVLTWKNEKRDIRKDFKTLFGINVRYIDAVVLMSDTDNTQQNVIAYYGDIYFSNK